jgi:hypothetical protein
MSYVCATCGEAHEGLPDLGFLAPDTYLEVPEAERDARTTLTEDLCTVRADDGDHYFIRGLLQLPVHGETEPFGLGVWVSQSKANFERYAAEEEMSPTFGWLGNHLPHHEETTFLLRTRVHFRAGGLRPTIELEPTSHPLAVEQRCGISLERAWAIVHRYSPN